MMAAMRLVCGLLALCAFLRGEPLWGQTEASSLLGRWQLRLWVTGPAARSAGLRAGSGQLELGWADLGSGADHRNVYGVTYDTTLHLMFGAPRFGPAQAVLTAEGKMDLAFNPFVDHGAFRLTGTIRGDSIIGEWQRTNFADDGYRGAFTMVRRH